MTNLNTVFNQNLARGISSDCSNRIKLGSLTALDRIITPQDSLLNCFRFLNLVQEFLYPVIKIKKVRLGSFSFGFRYAITGKREKEKNNNCSISAI